MRLININLIKKEILENLSFSIALVPTEFLKLLTAFVPVMIVSHLGPDVLAASGLVSILWSTASVVFVGALSSISVLISHYHSQKNNDKIKLFISHSWLIIIASVIFLMILLFLFPWILKNTHQSTETTRQAIIYSKSLIFSVAPFFYVFFLQSFLLGIGRAHAIFIYNLISVPILLIITYVFVLGKFGFPQLGIAGLGIGYGTSYFISGIGLTIYLIYNKSYRGYNIYHYPNPINLINLKPFINLGLPLGFSQFIELGSLCYITLLMSYFSTTVMASHQITLQFFSLLSIPAYAIANTVSMRISYAIGSNQKEQLWYIFSAGFFIALLVVFIILITFDNFNLYLLHLDIDTNNPKNQELVATTLQMFRMMMVCVFIGAIRNILRGILRGLQDGHFLLIASLVGLSAVILPIGYILGFHTHLQGVGLWLGLAIALLANSSIMACRVVYLLRINTNSR